VLAVLRLGGDDALAAGCAGDGDRAGLGQGAAGDALADKLNLQRNAIYKVIFDTRRKIRRALVAEGYLDEAGGGR
jgi:hypothetical protein